MVAIADKIGRLDWAVISYPLPGESESGDLFVIQEHQNGVLAGVVDGLGHGIEAAHAAKTAVDIITNYSHESVISIVRRCHEGLSQTRGAVMSLASFYFGDDTMTWISVGNVEGVLARLELGMVQDLAHIVLRGGVVGYQLPQLQASVIPVTSGDTMILATDGIRPEFYDDLHLNDSPEGIARYIGQRFRKSSDDSLALVIRYQ